MDYKEWEKCLSFLYVENEILVFRDEINERIVVYSLIIQLILEYQIHNSLDIANSRKHSLPSNVDIFGFTCTKI